MIRAVIADDELHAHERFKRVANEIESVEVLGTFFSSESLLSFLQKNEVDAVFLDIEMPGKSGLTLAQEIKELDKNVQIVFLTAYEQYAVQAFEIDVTDYLVKPVTAQRLTATAQRIASNKHEKQQNNKPTITCFGAFSVKVNGQILAWKNRRAKELMAFLVHKNGVPVSWEQITEALWFDLDYDKAHANLHTTMYRLRKHLSEAGIEHILEVQRDNYRIKPEAVCCDYYRFRESGELPPLFEGYFEEDSYCWATPHALEIKRLSKR